MQSFPFDPDPPIPIGQPALAAGEEAFTSALVLLQPALRGYIGSLLPGCSEIEDVLQEVNVLLWERRENPGVAGNFRGYAFRCAYFKALAWRRDAARAGRVVLSDALVQRVAEEAEVFWSFQAVRRAAALQACVERLTQDDRNLLRARYEHKSTLLQVAARAGKTKEAVYKAISRLRAALRACIQQKLEMEPEAL